LEGTLAASSGGPRVAVMWPEGDAPTWHNFLFYLLSLIAGIKEDDEDDQDFMKKLVHSLAMLSYL
jgi:hypothetical protein